MKIYANEGFNEQIVVETDDLPEGFLIGLIEMSEARPDDEFSSLYVATAQGTWVISPSLKHERLSAVERAWRAAEMPIARENVTAIDFGDETIPGTVAAWKSYWLALRAWDEGAPGYPDSTNRPKKPE